MERERVGRSVSIGQRSARRSNAARRQTRRTRRSFGAGGETARVSRLALVPSEIRCGETRARLVRARRGRRHARVPSPHTPVTLLSAAHSGSARPTPTDEANGPAGMCPVLCGPRGSRADDTTRATDGETAGRHTTKVSVRLEREKETSESLLRDGSTLDARQPSRGVASRVAAWRAGTAPAPSAATPTPFGTRSPHGRGPLANVARG